MTRQLRPEPLDSDPCCSDDDPTRVGPAPDDLTRVADLDALAILGLRSEVGEALPGRLDKLASCCRAKSSDDFSRELKSEAEQAAAGMSTFAITIVDLHLECDAECRFATATAAMVAVLRKRDTRHQNGDKIGIILPGLTEQGCSVMVGKLRSALTHHDIEASVGGAAWRDDDTLQSLVDRAHVSLARSLR